MATVRLTDKLKENIRRKVNAAFKPQHKEPEETLDIHFADRIYNYFFRKEIKIMDQLPDNYFATNSSFYIVLSSPMYDGTISTRCSSITQRKIPHCYINYNEGRFEIEHAAFYDELSKVREATKTIDTEQATVMGILNEGLDSCTTLKKFLQTMPEMEMFIPDDALRTHYERTEPRKRAAREEINIEVSDDAKLAMAKIKMSQS